MTLPFPALAWRVARGTGRVAALCLALAACGRAPPPAPTPPTPVTAPDVAPVTAPAAALAAAEATPSAATVVALDAKAVSASDAAPATPTGAIGAGPPAGGGQVPAAAEPEADALDIGRLRQQPRKKAPRLAVDLDGDGAAESLRVQQTPARPDWRGEPEKGPRFRLQVVAADGRTPLLEHGRVGLATGWMQQPLRLGGGRHGAFLIYSRPDDATPRTLLVRLAGESPRIEEVPTLPLEHWDVAGDGAWDAVHAITEELWQDFLRTGRSSLTRWQADGPVDLLPFAAFEVCVADREAALRQAATGATAAGRPAPLDLFAVERTGRKLHLLRPQADGRYRSVAALAVTPPDDGSRWSVPSGFALACLGGHRVQYKDAQYSYRAGRLKAAPRSPPR